MQGKLAEWNEWRGKSIFHVIKKKNFRSNIKFVEVVNLLEILKNSEDE